MTSIKTAILDDELLARQIIEGYVGKIDNLELVISTGNSLNFVNFMRENTIDLLFLDINMPEFNGLEVLRSMNQQPKVILTIAYSEYALESYEFGVLDYLLKPIKFERFLTAVNKMPIDSNQPAVKQEENLKDLQFKHEGMPVNISLDAILYFQSFGNYLRLFTKEKMYLMTETMTNMASFLPDNFQRTHKSYLVNFNEVEKMTGNHLFVNGEKIPVSPMYKLIIQRKIGL